MSFERLLCVTLVALTSLTSDRVFAQQPSGVARASADDITPTPEDDANPWGWLKMPTVTMPKITMPKMPADPLAPLKKSARKVGDGTKKAWEGTKELFTFGASKDGPSARTASNAESPSMWQRMFGGKEETQTPETVGEWMSQPRVN